MDFSAPIQRVSNKQKKLLRRPWLSNCILKLIKIKNSLHKRICRAKDPLNEEKLANKVKYYKVQIVSTAFKLEKSLSPTHLT